MSEDSFHLGVKALLRDKDDKILLLRVNPEKLEGKGDYWDLPGGRVQKGHSVAATLKREVAEETGITDITETKELGMVLSNIRIPIGDKTVGLILAIYECTAPGNSTVAISDEHVAYDWFDPKKVAELLAVKYPAHFCALIAKL